jgi:NitT/TauT family transport system substrate-binding protein
MGCGQGRRLATPQPIPIGYLASTINLPFFVALERGYFRDRGLNVQPLRFESTSELFNAVIAGRLDVTAVGGIAALYPIELQKPGVFKMYWFNSNAGEQFVDYLIARSDSAINSWTDLKGKKLGIFPGTTTEMGARLVLAHFGLLPVKDVEVIQLAPQMQLQALQAGRVDALLTLEPTGTIAVAGGIGRIVDRGPQMKYILQPFPGGAGVMRTDWIRRNAETARKIKQALDQAIDFTRASPEAAKLYLPKYISISEDVARKTRVCLYWKVEDADRASIQKFADILTREKVLPARVDMKDAYLSEAELRH